MTTLMLFSFIWLNFVLMKILATILAFYFSALIAQPMVTMVGNGLSGNSETCTTKSCCKHCKQHPEKKEQKKSPFGCCSNDMSNPFAQCCCCTGFIPEKQNSGVHVVMPNSPILVITYQGALIPNYSSDCWRPPEMAA